MPTHQVEPAARWEGLEGPLAPGAQRRGPGHSSSAAVLCARRRCRVEGFSGPRATLPAWWCRCSCMRPRAVRRPWRRPRWSPAVRKRTRRSTCKEQALCQSLDCGERAEGALVRADPPACRCRRSHRRRDLRIPSTRRAAGPGAHLRAAENAESANPCRRRHDAWRAWHRLCRTGLRAAEARPRRPTKGALHRAFASQRWRDPLRAQPLHIVPETQVFLRRTEQHITQIMEAVEASSSPSPSSRGSTA